MNTYIYLDYAAATPVDDRVLAAMQPYWQQHFYNPSANYLPAKQVTKDLHDARSKVAHWLGARPNEIIFTAGGTEANNLAIHGIMQQFPEGNIVVSAVEHEAILAPAQQYDCRVVGVLPDGTVDLLQLAGQIDENTVLVSIMYANNEVGTLQPLKDVARIIEQQRKHRGVSGMPIYFHTDACQAGNYLDLHVARLGVDMLTLNGGKVYGPKQSGALFISSRVQLVPEILGGGQERNLRSGTENVAQSIGLATALDYAQQQRHTEAHRVEVLQKQFMHELTTLFPEVIMNGSIKRRLPNNVHVTFPGQDNERLLLQLEQRGILAAAGSACSASNDEPSHVLKAMGISDPSAQSSIRFTLGAATTQAHITHVISALSDILLQK